MEQASPESRDDIIKLIFKAVPLAMGVAVVVLSTLGVAAPNTLVTLLGLGLAALSISSLQ